MGIHFMDAKDLRGVVVLYKCVFLIPNLLRKPNDYLPHGSYRNRGACSRLRKIPNHYKNTITL